MFESAIVNAARQDLRQGSFERLFEPLSARSVLCAFDLTETNIIQNGQYAHSNRRQLIR
jgi:hypothetical protein